jgi:peptidoglycan/xylan/chitin deacetylase (PgdA/CDA1 family)
MAGARRTLPPGSGAVALTFDDGPDPVYTTAVLDVLRELDAIATFFMVGARAERNPEIVRRVVDAGHAIGSHSATHPDMWELSLRDAVQEYRAGRRVLESIVRRSVPLFRPPKGSMNPSQALAIRALRFHPWLWSIDVRDWEPHATADGMLALLGTPGDGDIVLLHDAIERPIEDCATDRSSTVVALPRIIRAIREMGLTFETLH